MSEQDWARFEALVRSLAPEAPTHAQACGLALSRLIGGASAPTPDPGPLDWMDWERRKILRLLRPKP